MEIFVTLLETLFIAIRTDNPKYSPTLSWWTSVFITDIENLFGPRDSTFTLVGVDMDETDNAVPRVWFPNSGISPVGNGKQHRHVIIRLVGNALKSETVAKWQLAHECVHLLDPWNNEAEERQTNVLEEGIASWYQDLNVQGVTRKSGSYHEEAGSLVQPLMPDLASAIEHIRLQHQVRIGAIDDPDILLKHVPSMDPEVAEMLCRRFPSN